jgi:hypothetical protein
MTARLKEEEPEAPEPEATDDLMEKIEAGVRKVVGSLIGSGELDVADDDEKGEPEPEPKEPTTVREVEKDAEGSVQEAVRKILAEKEHEAEHERMKKEPERPPMQVRRLTRALWGEP